MTVHYLQLLLPIFLAAGFAGYLRIRKGRGGNLLLAGLSGLFLVSWPPIDWLFARPLETRYGGVPLSLDSAQSIVVLGSSVTPSSPGLPYAVPDKDTYERCNLAAWVHTHGHPVPVLACSGAVPYQERTMMHLLETFGVPVSMIWTETSSHSTHENAVFGSTILKQHQIRTIVLVTEAQDMLRAELCFRKEGLAVIPYPIGVRNFGPLNEELLPSWRAIERNERTLHEVLGLGWYWLRGWI